MPTPTTTITITTTTTTTGKKFLTVFRDRISLKRA
jgi:hypothetical protein